MHILIIPFDPFMPPHSALSGIFQCDQALALKETGHKVGIISVELCNPLTLAKRYLLKQTIPFNDQRFVFPVLRKYVWVCTPYFRPGYNWQFVQAGTKIFEKYIKIYGTPDIIHAHNALRAGILARKIKDKFKVPYVITEHSSIFARNKVHASDLSFICDAYREANKRLVVSPALGNLLEDIFADVFQPWEAVGNILDSRFEEKNISNKLPPEKKKNFCFLNVGSLIPIKGQTELLKAFATMFRGKQNINLKIIGGGLLRENLEFLSRQLAITDQVTFLGELDREEVIKHMAAADVYVHSSHYETFGVAIIEAMACGKPVIATKCGGPEYIVEQNNGILIAKNNITALGNAMEYIKSNINSYDYKLIKKNCIARFGTQTMTNKLSKIYIEICPKEVTS